MQFKYKVGDLVAITHGTNRSWSGKAFKVTMISNLGSIINSFEGPGYRVALDNKTEESDPERAELSWWPERYLQPYDLSKQPATKVAGFQGQNHA